MVKILGKTVLVAGLLVMKLSMAATSIIKMTDMGFSPKINVQESLSVGLSVVMVQYPDVGGVITLVVQSDGAASVVLPKEFVQLSQITINPKEIVVFGYMNSALATGVAIFDRASGSLLDVFWCYDPTMSQDESSIIFEQFYPSHFLETENDPVYRLYDLTKSPDFNRLTVQNNDVPQVRWMLAGEELPLYYPGIINNSRMKYARHSGFFWDQTGASVSFIVRSGEKYFMATFDKTGKSKKILMTPLKLKPEDASALQDAPMEQVRVSSVRGKSLIILSGRLNKQIMPLD